MVDGELFDVPSDSTYCRDLILAGIREERDRLRVEKKELQKELTEAEATIESIFGMNGPRSLLGRRRLRRG